MKLHLFTGFVIVALIGLAVANPKPPVENTGWATIAEPAPPQGIIKDADKLVNEARATLKAFNDGGVTVKLTNPPKTTPRPDVGGLPRPRDAVCPGGTCPVTPTVKPPSASARPANVAGSGGACRVGAIRRLFGRRGG